MKKLALCVGFLMSTVCLPLSAEGQADSLQDAATKGDLNEVNRLIAEGADVNTKDKAGNVPLHKAAVRGDADMVRVLIAAGASVRVKNNNGQTPLHVAASADKAAVVELLIANGARVNAKDKHGHTALSLAKLVGNADVIGILEHYGAKSSGLAPGIAKIVLHGPGLELAPVTSEIRPSFANVGVESGTIELKHWRGRGEWPQAWLQVRQIYTGFMFSEGRPLAEINKRRFRDVTEVSGKLLTSANDIGRLEYQRFTRTRKGEKIACVGMREYARLRVVNPNFLPSATDDTRILGWYCAPPSASLSDETVTQFLQGIRVEGDSK